MVGYFLALVSLALLFGSANAVDASACNPAVAFYDYSFGDCVYKTSELNQRALDWYSSHPYDAANQNPWIKYRTWTDAHGITYKYDQPRYFDDYYDNRGNYYEDANAVRASQYRDSRFDCGDCRYERDYYSSYGYRSGYGYVDYGYPFAYQTIGFQSYAVQQCYSVYCYPTYYHQPAVYSPYVVDWLYKPRFYSGVYYVN